MDLVFDLFLEKPDDGADINTKYGRELAALTAAGWRAQLRLICRPRKCPIPRARFGTRRFCSTIHGVVTLVQSIHAMFRGRFGAE